MEEYLKQKRRRFDRQFKIDAVKYWSSSGKSGEEVCLELGIPNRYYLNRWKKELKKKGDESAFPGKGKQLGPDADLAQLRKELRDVAEERDILKKALAILSRY